MLYISWCETMDHLGDSQTIVLLLAKVYNNRLCNCSIILYGVRHVKYLINPYSS